jgi:Nif-specific regulatory protein
MEAGKFREDLYYRLNVFPIHIPPLRDRKSDITLLADYFTEKYSKANHKAIRRISTSAINLLMNYHWPGNVRELENCVERAVLLSVDEVIHGHHMPPSLQSAESTNTQLQSTLPEAMESIERELILDALKSTKGNMAKAARFLGISERIMGLRVKKHRIESRIFRNHD